MHYICDCVSVCVCITVCVRVHARALVPAGQAAAPGLSVTLDESACFSVGAHLRGVCPCVPTPLCLCRVPLGPVCACVRVCVCVCVPLAGLEGVAACFGMFLDTLTGGLPAPGGLPRVRVARNWACMPKPVQLASFYWDAGE